MKRLKMFFAAISAAAVTVSVQAALSETYNFTVNDTVPDNNPSGLSDAQTIGSSSINEIADVQVTLHISGGFNGDLYCYVSHSSGFSVLLNRTGKTSSSAFGYADPGFDVTFNGTAANDVHLYQTFSPSFDGQGRLTGMWQPDARNVDPANVLDTDSRTATLSSFNGLNANGKWTLFVADLHSGAVSSVDSWSLQITGVPEPVNVALLVFGGVFACAIGVRSLARKWVARGR